MEARWLASSASAVLVPDHATQARSALNALDLGPAMHRTYIRFAWLTSSGYSRGTSPHHAASTSNLDQAPASGRRASPAGGSLRSPSSGRPTPILFLIRGNRSRLPLRAR